MHQQTTTHFHMLRPVRRPFAPRTLNERLRGRYDTPDEVRAERLLRAVAPTAAKIKRRDRAALKAAVAILEVAPVELDRIQSILDALPDTPHLSNVRRGRVEDAYLWDDAQTAMRMAMHGHATAGADTRLGTCLAVVAALLAVPEHVRWAAVAEREAA